ncbi:MAG TPA: heme lyase CcmF/NrfE family subunit [Stellaceae bacterium]|jgi:cytochrome c-type biogenesis protein CcmF|nr:heme lyase CcmF/NrfE family subunit [Stellaceae bacterium]
MINEIGHFALVLALCVSALQMVVPLVGAARGDAALTAWARPAAIAQFLFIATAFFALMHAYAVSDFSLANVAANSSSMKPLLFKLSGVWSNHEGSMLLWVFILALFGAAVAVFGRNLPPSLRARVLSVQAMIGFGFLLFILLTSNPFVRLFPVPAEGAGLNPILEDRGLAFHPPCLYLGYVGFSISFCFAIAALIEGRVDPAWARWVRPWTLAAWCALTTGIAMGSWWSYYTLGWGGWWFWDPVENASFMPWLVGTALLHSAIVVEKRDTLKTWTILLAIITFSLSLIGTFLVRSGVLTSVHAFASDPRRGVFILLLLGAYTGGALLLFAWRAPQLVGGGLFAPISREGGLLLNNLLLTTAAATVFLGTLYPLFLDVVAHQRVSVGPPFYAMTFVPIMVPLLIAMAVGPMLPWKRGDLLAALSHLKWAFLATAAAAIVVLAIAGVRSIGAACGLALAAWLLIGTAVELAERVHLFGEPLASVFRRARRLPRSAWGMTFAHAGMAVVIAGITGSTAWTEERIVNGKPGQSFDIAGYTIKLDAVNEVQGPDFTATQADMRLLRDGTEIAALHPEKRFYPVENGAATGVAIRTNMVSDIYAVIGDPDGKGGYVLRLYYNPLVPWIWLGAAFMALGGLVSLSDRRHRVGAPARRARPVADAGVQAAE